MPTTAEAVAQNTITIEHIGPIERLDIPIPSGGGVVVLQGRNGSGKSHALRAADNLLTGRQSGLETQDGMPLGFVEGLGAKLTVGKRARRSGTLEVQALESKLDPSMLVDPGLKDADANDARRIRALISLAGVKPNLSDFYALFGGKEEFDAVVTPDAVTGDDLLTMAGKIKRDAEAGARKAEKLAADARAQGKTLREQIEGIDLAAVADVAAVQSEHEQAVRRLGELEGLDAAARQAQESSEQAAAMLEHLEGQQHGVSLTEANEAMAAAAAEYEAAQVVWMAAEQKLLAARAKREAADKAVKFAASNQRIRDGWRTTIDRSKADLAKAPSALDLAHARQRRDELKAAILTAQKTKEAKATAAVAALAFSRADDAEKASMRLREQAAAVDDVLSKAVQSAGIPELGVSGGRLVTKTRRGKTLYSDLSQGERWRLALDIAIRQVGEGGLLACSQEAWESLDPQNREAIAEQVTDHGVTLLTAEATDGELVVKVMENQ